MTVKLLFSRRRDWISPIIRLATWSEWPHVDLIDWKKGTVVGATRENGVIEAPIDGRIATASKAAIMTLEGIDDSRIIDWARSHIGDGYDWPGLFGFVFRQQIEIPEKQFCSELIALAFAEAKHPIIRPGDEWKVTPQDIWKIGGLGKVEITREYVK